MSKAAQLYTIGYSGYCIDRFVEKLLAHQIHTVVDVRRRPVSRKRGFSKKSLSLRLESEKLEYVHLSELGVPDAWRRQLRTGECSLADYLESFQGYLDNQQATIEQLYRLASSKRCCLICVEADHQECHRSIVAEVVASCNGKFLEVIHL